MAPIHSLTLTHFVFLLVLIATYDSADARGKFNH